MNIPHNQNPLKSPEIVSGNSVGRIVSSPIATSGEIRFNQPAPTIEDPLIIIEKGKTTPIEVYRQRADEALLKKAA